MLADHFPNTRAANPELLDWQQPFDWTSPLRWPVICKLLDRQIAAGDESMAALLAIGDPLRDDLIAATLAKADDPEQAANVDILRFLTSLPVVISALIEGDYGLAYDWLHAGASRDFEIGRRINEANFIVPPFEHGDAHGNAVATANLIRWYRALYAVATKLGGVDVLALHYAQHAIALAVAALGTEQRSRAVELLASFGEWAAERRQPQARFLAAQLEALVRSQAFTARDRVISGIVLTGSLAPYSTRSAGEWARHIITRFPGDIVEHEIVQLHALAADSPAEWHDRRTTILTAVRALADFYRARVRSGGDAGMILESRVKILHPLVHHLATFGSVDDIMDLLWAWYGRADRERADAHILFVCPAYGDGTAYVWPGGRSLPQGADPGNLDRFLTTLSLAHSQMFRGPEGDRPFDIDDNRWGYPSHEHAEDLHRDMAILYDFDRVRAALPPEFRPRATVVVPSHRDPLQAALSEALGLSAPLEASVAAARPMRPRRLMSIWRDDAVQLVDAEVEMLQSIGDRAGWNVHVFDGGQTADQFLRFYEDPEPDLLWVISHGEMDAHDLTRSGIVMGDRSILPIRDVGELVVPNEDRRLLVLNICSGGAAQNRGGLASLGLAQTLAGPSQLVIAHQWPIDSYPALTFASAFMVGLIEAEVGRAFSNTAGLMQDIEGLRAALTAVDPGLSTLDRLDVEAARTAAGSILNWGNAALYT